MKRFDYTKKINYVLSNSNTWTYRYTHHNTLLIDADVFHRSNCHTIRQHHLHETINELVNWFPCCIWGSQPCRHTCTNKCRLQQLRRRNKSTIRMIRITFAKPTIHTNTNFLQMQATIDYIGVDKLYYQQRWRLYQRQRPIITDQIPSW